MNLGARAAGGALLFAFASVAFPAGEPDRWRAAETLKYRVVSDPRVSPDGKRVANVARESVMEPEKSESRATYGTEKAGR